MSIQGMMSKNLLYSKHLKANIALQRETLAACSCSLWNFGSIFVFFPFSYFPTYHSSALNECDHEDLNDCSEDAVCRKEVVDGFTCECKPGFKDRQPERPGTECEIIPSKNMAIRRHDNDFIPRSIRYQNNFFTLYKWRSDAPKWRRKIDQNATKMRQHLNINIYIYNNNSFQNKRIIVGFFAKIH